MRINMGGDYYLARKVNRAARIHCLASQARGDCGSLVNLQSCGAFLISIFVDSQAGVVPGVLGCDRVEIQLHVGGVMATVNVGASKIITSKLESDCRRRNPFSYAFN